MEKYIYSIISQQTSASADQSDSVFFSALHASVRSSLEKQAQDDQKSANEVIQKAVSGLRGALSPYLSTPLKSDKGDIEKSIKDNFDFVVQQLSGSGNTSSFTIATYRVLEPSQVPLKRQSVGIMRRLLKNGKRMLTDGGVSTGRNNGPAYLTEILAANILAVPVLHSSVREYFSRDSEKQFVVVNDGLSTVLQLDQPGEGGTERILLNVALEMEALARVKERCAVLKNQSKIGDVCLTERSLFSGGATSIQLYCTADLSVHPLGSIVLSLVGDDPSVENAIATNGSLLILKKIA